MGLVKTEDNGAILMGIAFLIRNGQQEGTVSKVGFKLVITGPAALANMSTDDWAHIAQLVNGGYTSGEVIQTIDDLGTTRRGWWDLFTK